MSLLLAAIALPVAAIVVAVMVIRLGGGESQPIPSDGDEQSAPLPVGDTHDLARAASDTASVDTGAGAPAAAGATREQRTGERFTPRRRSAPAAAPPATAPPAAESDPEPELDAIDVIPELRAAGEREGIAAFGLPGTDPPKPGIIVPEGFPLPEGYVRHHQVSDDGERLPAILMFHPDYDFLDARGIPMKLPENHVVPPEMAPPGLPIEMLEVPAPEGVRDPAP